MSCICCSSDAATTDNQCQVLQVSVCQHENVGYLQPVVKLNNYHLSQMDPRDELHLARRPMHSWTLSVITCMATRVSRMSTVASTVNLV